MDSVEITEINTEELNKIIAEKREKDYALIDVRQEFEYNESHIPGAVLIEISEIIKNPGLVPDSKEIVFYCKSGHRSKAAAKFFVESGKADTNSKVFNLEYGIDEWKGAELEVPPKIDLFKGKTNIEDLIIRAMELEKGAYNFYSYIYDNFQNLPYLDTINILRKAETAHAKTLFKRLQRPMDEFNDFFSSINGDILESGINTEEAVKKIESFKGNFCINILEFLLLIEVSAYDLYKVMAAREKEAEKTFLMIAQEEKAHMRSIASSFVLCA